MGSKYVSYLATFFQVLWNAVESFFFFNFKRFLNLLKLSQVKYIYRFVLSYFAFHYTNSVTFTAQKMKFTLRISSVNVTTADLVTFTKEILNGKLHLLFRVLSNGTAVKSILDIFTWSYDISTKVIKENYDIFVTFIT